MQKIANVFVNIPVKSISKSYSYSVPEKFDFITAGWRVLVSFGNRNVEGFIIEVIDQEDITGLKSIIDIVDQEPWFSTKMLEAARWMSAYYLCSVAETMRLFMPGKAGLKIKIIYRTENEEEAIVLLSRQRAIGLEIYQYLQEKQPLAIQELRKQFSQVNIEKIVNYFLKKQIISKDYDVKKQAVDKFEKIAELNSFNVELAFTQLSRKPAQRKLFQLLVEHKKISVRELKLAQFSMQTINQLAESGFIKLVPQQVLRDSYQSIFGEQTSCLVLSDEQKAAFEEIEEKIAKGGTQTFLLHGITGSGKTQIYIEAVKMVRKNRRQAIILVPEIGLTSQIVKRFKAYFDDDIIVMHSRLSISERNDAILRIKRNEVGIVIGARSAIFTPLDNIGIIIMDEEHDSSYKQDESPRYHTRDIAKKLVEIHAAVLILGSATPSIESYCLAQQKAYILLELTKRIGDMPLPFVHSVDMREELRLGRRNIISEPLKTLIVETIKNKEQLIILLNRRGFSTFVLCRECGYVVNCKQCTLPMVYHKNGKLQCHYCDTMEQVPDVCPKCTSRYIKYFGTGTERLEDELRKLFSNARIARMDRDTTGKKFGHGDILDSFEKGQYDILLGTQMVAKGHDIKNVTAVGILSADAGLNMPDFRAAERCFSLITQAAGRAGRGNIRGKVVVQTYNPEHYAVIAGINHDYNLFYQHEILLRKQLFYPPYSQLIKLTIQNPSEELAYNEAAHIISLFKKFLNDGSTQILGPAPSLISKLKDLYRINVLIKTKNYSLVQKYLVAQNVHLRNDIIIDVNPLNVM